jgi:hypothetical protein
MFGGTLHVSNCTITLNNLGIYSGSPSVTVVKSSIIAGNGSADLSGAFVSRGFNLIGSIGNDIAVAAGFTNGVSGDQVGSMVRPIDARLGPLQNNGGPTLTHALLAGSPAIDKGSGGGSSADQRGHIRTFDFPTIANAASGDGTDIGAFELESRITRIENLGSDVRITFLATSNQNYTVEWSQALPATAWTAVSNLRSGVNGETSVIDRNTAAFPTRFYRVRQN